MSQSRRPIMKSKIPEELRELLRPIYTAAELADIEKSLSAPQQTVLNKIDAMTPKQVAERLVEIVHAQRRKILRLPRGATPNMTELAKLVKCFDANTQLTEHFERRGLPKKLHYRWPIHTKYGQAFTLFDTRLDIRGVADELAISLAHARVLRSRWRHALQSERRP